MLYAIVAVLILIVDQGVKYWITVTLPLNSVEELIPGVLALSNIHNTGAAFGLMDSWPAARWLFLAITVVFAAVCIWALATKKVHGALGRWTVVAVLAGALGNGIDRAIHGYVVDMFAFQGFLDWFPVFNVADIALVVGAVVFCLYVIFHKDALQGAETGKTPAPAPGQEARLRRQHRGEGAAPAPGGEKKAASAKAPAQAVSRPARPAGHQNPRPAPAQAKTQSHGHTPVSGPRKTWTAAQPQHGAQSAAPARSAVPMPDPKDPFAEWESPTSAQAQAARAAREQAEQERARREQLAREQAEREQLAREQAAQQQAAREQAVQPQESRQQAAKEQPAPVRPAARQQSAPASGPARPAAAPASSPAPGSKTRIQVGNEVVEFSLEDILAEFGEH